jgi:hypothetical protein
MAIEIPEFIIPLIPFRKHKELLMGPDKLAREVDLEEGDER